ncbi:MAG: BMP family lipoprotein [Anaerovoracaceae bacterium]
MKRILTALLVVALAVTVSSCTSQENKEVTSPPKVIFVTAAGGLNDNGENDEIWEACSDAADEFDADIRCLESETSSDVAANVEAASDDMPAVVVTCGSDGAKAAKQSAASHSDINYVVVDTEVKADNVASIIFQSQDASFLAGIAAADVSEQECIGIILDRNNVSAASFYGFSAGVETGNSNATVKSVYLGTGGTDTDGMTAAKTLNSNGCDVIFTMTRSGEQGVMKYAKLKDMKVITVSGDSSRDDDDDSDVLLGVVERDAEEALAEEIHDAVDGNFRGGVRKYGLESDMVGFDAENGLSDSNENALESWEKLIKSGKLDVPATKAEFSTFDPSEFR